MRRNTVTTPYLVELIVKRHRKINEVANLVGMSRQAIYNRLRHANVNPSHARWLSLPCAFCGSPIRRRWRLRSHTPNARSFCGRACYAGYRLNPNFYESRHGTRLSRLIVGKYFSLDNDMIVHHKDGDERNNDLANLCVFASHSDHMKYHHSKSKVEPLWDGINAKAQALIDP